MSCADWSQIFQTSSACVPLTLFGVCYSIYLTRLPWPERSRFYGLLTTMETFANGQGQTFCMLFGIIE
jgi:hypothetical protein